MYKAITSLWSKSTSGNKIQLSSNSPGEDDSWVFVSDGVIQTSTMKNNNLMTNSWIASPPLIKTDELPENVQNLNPIENLLIEHASMSVYEQIASKTRNRRQKKIVNDNKLDEEVEEDDDDDDDDRETMSHQYPNLTSTHHRNLNLSSISSTSTLETSTSSLVAHHRHLYRLHHRRKRSTKLLSTNNIDEPKQVLNENIERQRLNQTRPPKILQQSSRSNH